MAKTFTTWAALKTQLLDDFARGAHEQKSYTCENTTITFRDFAEFREMLEYVERRAAAETARPVRRTYAGQGATPGLQAWGISQRKTASASPLEHFLP
ncbi:MAG: hypothetical protein AB7E32_15455 [Desulfovibrio sp.]